MRDRERKRGGKGKKGVFFFLSKKHGTIELRSRLHDL